MSKKPVGTGELIAGAGLAGDAHCEPGSRAVSLMMLEDIEKARRETPPEVLFELQKSGLELGPGAYAENITTAGFDLTALRPGDEIRLGERVRLRVTEIGKTCHHGCEIRQRLGDCIFPRRGIFAQVITGGVIRAGDVIEKD